MGFGWQDIHLYCTGVIFFSFFNISIFWELGGQVFLFSAGAAARERGTSSGSSISGGGSSPSRDGSLWRRSGISTFVLLFKKKFWFPFSCFSVNDCPSIDPNFPFTD